MIIPIRPLYKIDTSIMAFPSPFQTVYMFYTYYHLWKKVLALVIFGEKFGTDYLLPADLSKVPILFLYGKEKRAIFHDKITVKVLEREHKEKRSKSNAICIEDVGHWLYLQKADECFEHIKNFMLTEN
jgi:pimeloyl-ACP methyl ester carboxylesterase